ncbi:hypothetical protein EVB68_012 [Rhizobium phage RHph_Y2_6]|uniref:Uncharacterized protein n=1 Tax=Rhizobium phage RHph_Y2_6 TaxID=2509576 RepID=A0A7S5RAF4_9CAUD|nr:hypothetical protein PP748_gp012 [Rhizobium phage RHph_Y2_6]QIG68749.1 hypothetical protein EVB68_012 [Rhizobium phage RHph_Y2_6]
MKYAVSIIVLIYSVLFYYVGLQEAFKVEAMINLTIFTLIIPILVCYLVRHITMWFSIMYIRRNL